MGNGEFGIKKAKGVIAPGRVGIGDASPSGKLQMKDGRRIEDPSDSGADNKHWKLYLSGETGDRTELRNIIT